MKIKGKLIISYLALGLLVIVLGAVSLFSLGQMNANSESTYYDRVIPIMKLGEVGMLTENTRVQVMSAVVNRDPSLTANAEENIAKVAELLEEYQSTAMTAQETEVVQRFESEWNIYAERVQVLAGTISQGDYDAAEVQLGENAPYYSTAKDSLIELEELNVSIAESTYKDSVSLFEFNRLLIYIIGIAVVIAAIVLGIFMGRAIGGPLARVADRMQLVANGDLTNEPIHSKRKDEIGVLVKATNKMQEDLRSVIQSISAVTGNVSAQSEELTQSSVEVREGSEQIAVTMQELASGSEAQANNAGELSEKMELFALRIQEINDQSADISRQSESVIRHAEDGSSMMEESVQQMMVIDDVMADAVQKVRGLDHQTNEISKLVNVIREVAEQTNLLALNAAIEAARAGEHGKGFAVVADEVRKLAEQVASSVNEITGFVSGIQIESKGVVTSLEKGYGEVNTGTQKIAGTGEKFNEINHSIKNMIEMVSQISVNLSAINENSQVMNASIQEIASVSEEAAAGIEETAASSQQSLSTIETISASADELAKLAEGLSDEVGKFKLT
ncbi:methyl-accepting chemotaxis protein [Jeotgalibacillus sp. R-1-5s-1]|uniref:methyl-accepting chemotaxis protein n=1 Tax=Jeotgalibacillus sp. R-1-5s-1 TaxID=2555897 RepID=UPI001068FBC0|nr:methyl-accepting chemotaxis protein [Jeotgalibacillus sp. R-1-5s-1]TFD95807.1 methyl-accepting chemotaxis protein [Jeotgalibacillus sp. R-1-5s-1]